MQTNPNVGCVQLNSRAVPFRTILQPPRPAYSEPLLHRVTHQQMEENISVWEGEGGSLSEGFTQDLTGSVNQIEWAERIRAQVNGEFDRVSKALQAAALKQSDQDRLDTYAMMLILEEKRARSPVEREGRLFHSRLAGTARPGSEDDHERCRYKAIKAHV